MPLLPPVRLAPAAELAAAVRAAPLAADLIGLGRWATSMGAPVTSEAVPGFGRDADWFWALATGTAFLDLDDAETAAIPGPALTRLLDGTDDLVLEVWTDVCYAVLHPEELGGETTGLPLLQLFALRVPMEAAELPGHEPLRALGLVERRGDRVALTPLGLWAGREYFYDMTGQDVPEVGSLADADAATLLYSLRCYPAPEQAEELAGWLAGREPGEAAGQVAGALAGVSPLSRAIGLSLLADDLGEEGRAALDGLLEVPRLGALVSTRLDAEAAAVHDSGDVAWVLTDMAASLIEFGGAPEEILAELNPGGQAAELADMVAMLAVGDHEDTGHVLAFMIEHHPDKSVTFAARKALRRLRGLADERPGARGRKPRKPKRRR